MQVGASFAIPVTASFQTFVDVSITGVLTQGKHILKIVEETGGLNLNNILFVKQNEVPTVSIAAPTNNAVYTAPASIMITVNANDADGTISKVEFYNGTTLLNFDNAAPYTYNSTNVAMGTYLVTAKVFDNVNASTISAAIHIEVETSVSTSIASASSTLGIIAVPTPFETTTISTSGINEIQTVVIYNAIGQQMQRIENVSANEVVIGEALSDGMYLVYITSTNGTTTMKVLKGN